MRHRHLDVQGGHYSVAAIHSIMERGGATDMIELLTVLRAAPYSEAAEAALKAAETSDVYGYPELIRECIRAWREESGSGR